MAEKLHEEYEETGTDKKKRRKPSIFIFDTADIPVIQILLTCGISVFLCILP